MSLNEAIAFALSVSALIGVVFAVYKTFREPDIKADKDMALMKQGCEDKHKNLDATIAGIHESISFIQNNHLKHIEVDIKALQEGQVKLFTILDERLPKR